MDGTRWGRGPWPLGIAGGGCGRRSGFSLVEVMVAVAILALTFLFVLSLLSVHRVQAVKARDRAIALDFAQHYLETARSEQFGRIVAGSAINALYGDEEGAVFIPFPPDEEWVDLTEEAYSNFHPDLFWLSAREPQMRCVITSIGLATAPDAKHLELEVRWRAPFHLGGEKWLTLRLDTVVYPDFY